MTCRKIASKDSDVLDENNNCLNKTLKPRKQDSVLIRLPHTPHTLHIKPRSCRSLLSEGVAETLLNSTLHKFGIEVTTVRDKWTMEERRARGRECLCHFVLLESGAGWTVKGCQELKASNTDG